jgi:hypothetical protein
VATKFLTNLDLRTNQILNATFEVLTEDPTTGLFEGRMYYNSTYDIIRYYTGTTWKLLVNGVVAGGSNASALTVSESAGTITLTLNLANAESAGLLSAAFFNDLNDATSSATAGKLAKRDVNGNISVAEPTSPGHAATKNYVDAARSGLDVKQSVRLTTNAALPTYTHLSGVLTASANGALEIDGATLSSSDNGIRILVKNETSANAPYNGIYVLTDSGDAGSPYILTRADDADSSAEVTPGMFVFVEQGTAWADSGWVLTTDGTIILGTTNLTFVQFSSAGQSIAGNGLTKIGNTIDVVGTADRITVTADAVDIANTYAGQTTITTVGTIGTGTWEATDVGVAHGGTGASVAGDARINLAAGGTRGAGVSAPVLSRTVALTIGDGVNLSYVVQHGLGTRDVIVQVYEVSGGSPTYETVVTDVTRTDTNNVTVAFTSAPASNAYRVVVTG